MERLPSIAIRATAEPAACTKQRRANVRPKQLFIALPENDRFNPGGKTKEWPRSWRISSAKCSSGSPIIRCSPNLGSSPILGWTFMARLTTSSPPQAPEHPKMTLSGEQGYYAEPHRLARRRLCYTTVAVRAIGGG